MLDLLRRQKENLNSFLKTITGKQKAIVANNISEIEKFTSDEEKLLREINQTEKLRLECLSEFIKDKNLNPDTFKMDDYITSVSAELNVQQQKEFSNLRDEIKETTSRIMQINRQTKYVIHQSRSLLNEIVTAIFKEKSNSLLDVKV